MLALLSSAFNLAVRWGWRADNPAKGIERFHEDRRERFLSGEELNRLVDALNDHPNRRSANAVRLLLLTGARRGEVLGATWDHFDLGAGLWTKPSAHTKQKRAHRVPLSAPALALLVAMRAETDATGHRSPYLFPGDAPGKPLGDIKNFWKSVCMRAGVEGVRLHDMRHQYASMLASAGLSLPIIGRLLGHTQAATTARYAHLFDDPLRAATERVGALVNNAGKSKGEAVPPRPAPG
jgi:integrase